MAHLPIDVVDHFASHHGVASHATLCTLGLSRDRIIGLQRTGTLEQVLKGVYLVRLMPFDDLARGAAVCAAHDDAVIAGPTAGRLWGFRRLPKDGRIHAIVEPHRQPSIEKWLVPYRTKAIRDADVVDRGDGLRVTSRARTALDLARHVGDVDLLSIIEQAARDGRLADADLRAVAVDFISARRPWLRRYLVQLERRLEGGAAESHPEVILGEALARVGVRPLVRQFEIDLPGYGPARFDLASPPLRWAIEVDGFPTHFETEGRRRDAVRDQAAASIGWDVDRVTPGQFGPALADTVAELRQSFDHRRLAR